MIVVVKGAPDVAVVSVDDGKPEVIPREYIGVYYYFD
jgi:hypothetical protein